MNTLLNSKMCQLHQLKHGEQAKILGYQGGSSHYRHKLLAFGMVPGTHITLQHIAPLGDPVEIVVRGSSLSLRKHEADCLLLERI